MTLKEELRSKIVDVAEWMQLINEFTNTITPIPVQIDGKTYALALHPIEQQAEEKSKSGDISIEEIPAESVTEPAPQDGSIEEFLG